MLFYYFSFLAIMIQNYENYNTGIRKKKKVQFTNAT